MQEPLLPAHGREARAPGLSSACKCTGIHTTVVAALRHWWRVTTDKEFLRSKMSRRPLQKVIIPILGLFYLSVDAFAFVTGSGQAWWLLADSVYTLAACAWALSSLGSETLLVDAVFGCILGIYAVLAVLMQTDACNPLTMLTFPMFMMVSCLLGFHSLALCWLWALSVVCCIVILGFYWPVGILTSLLALGGCLVEFVVAELYREGQTLLRCNQKLLDFATDGFGVVDCETGVLVETSTKMVQMLGGRCHVGQKLQSLVDQCGHAALTTFFGDGQWQAALPVLVTCMLSESLQCDIRMVPYHLHSSKMGFCLQRVGEVRECRTEAPEAREHPTEAPEAGPATTVGGATTMGGSVAGAAAHAGTAADADDSISQVMGRAPPAAASQTGSAEPRSHQAAPMDHMERRSKASGGTLSLSSWSLQSGEGGRRLPTAPLEKSCKSGKKTKKHVETRTYGVQVNIKQKPPAPLTASTVPVPVQVQASRKRRLARACSALVIEGRPRLKRYAATPKATRHNALLQLARSCNVVGTGCCELHVAWMALQVLISDELVQPCSRFPLSSDWQCPSCLAVRSFDVGCDKQAEMKTDQICGICQELVEPDPGQEEVTSPRGEPQAVDMVPLEDSADASCSSASEASCR